MYRNYSWAFKQVKAPESVYRRAVNWGWELANKLKNHRQYSDDEVFETLNELEQWKFYIRNIPVPEHSGLKIVKDMNMKDMSMKENKT